MSKIEVNQVDTQCGSTLTLGSSGKTVTLASGASQSGFGRTGTVDWCTTAKTSPFTAVSGNGYFVNTTSGTVTVTLPASPSAGDIVAIQDYANTSSCNKITVGRNSSKIDGGCIDASIVTNGESFTLVYVDSTEGWKTVNNANKQINTVLFVTATGGTVSTCGDFKIHTFTSSDNFVVSCAGNPGGSDTVDYLVVAGGGAGSNQTSVSNNFLSGGGGGGGYRESSGAASGSYTRSPLGACVAALPVTAQTYPVTVGGGAASGSLNGTPSVFSTITSTGGGSGGANPTPGVPGDGQPGGSGGGGFYGSRPGGSGNTPPVSPAQGTNGGTGAGPTTNGGGGGGGATVAGANASSGAGAGGAGATSEITNSPVVRAGGGGGGSGSGGTGGAAGSGGGGAGGSGQTPNPTHGAAGTVNTGGGAGGSSDYSVSGTAASAGGSGIVVIRYKFQ